jgi:hypothetical protein
MREKNCLIFSRNEILIEMKINAFDLPENPKMYRIKVNNHRIESSV